MTTELKNKWTGLLSQFTTDEELITSSWQEIQQQYTKTNRAYHNLTHIHSMLQGAQQHEALLADKEVMHFSIWLHDIIYNSLKKDNEQQSAEVAKRILSQTSLSKNRIEACYQQILLTIKHEPLPNSSIDEKLLIDFDLEILSRDWEGYQIYCQQIRKEYWMYPNFLYKKGRKKAMEHFLKRPTIYQTAMYQQKEAQARANIQREINELL